MLDCCDDDPRPCPDTANVPDGAELVLVWALVLRVLRVLRVERVEGMIVCIVLVLEVLEALGDFHGNQFCGGVLKNRSRVALV